MGNSSIYDNNNNSYTNENIPNQTIINKKLIPKPSRNDLLNKYKTNKKQDLDLFKIIDNNPNQNIQKDKEIKSGIKLKNNMMREETTVSYNISSISHNPLKKMENEILKNKKLSRNELNIIDDSKQLNLFMTDNMINKEDKLIKINKNLFEFEANNSQHIQYNEDKNDILTSERTINNMNNEGEFFFDSSNNKDNYKNNIFSNITKYEIKKDKINNNKEKNVIINNIEKKDKQKEKYGQFNIKLDNLKCNNKNLNTIKPKSKGETNKYNKIIKINNTNNNLYVISSFLSNKNNNQNNAINKRNYSYRNNKSYNQKENNNKIYKNFSYKNIPKNSNTNINTVNTKYKFRPKFNKDKINIIPLSNKLSKNYSYNLHNYSISNDSNNLYEKQKLTELIKKIPNNELKDEIMTLYQRITNNINDIIINNKDDNYNYIVTFSSNYIKINENTFLGKKFDNNNLIIKNIVKICFISNNQYQNNKKNDIHQNININKMNLNKDDIKPNNNNNENKLKDKNNKTLENTHNNLMLNKIDNESVFKKFTFMQFKNSRNTKSTNKNTNSQHFETINTINSINTINNSNNNENNNKNKNENNTIKMKVVKNSWKKIINLNEVTINKDKIFPFNDIERNSFDSIKQEKNMSTKKRRINSSNLNQNSVNIISTNKKLKSKSIDKYKTKTYINSYINNEKIFPYGIDQEDIIFYKRMKKLINIKNILKEIKNYKKKIVIKEEDLVIFNVLCLISQDYFFIFKDKEKMRPLFKKDINLMQKIKSFKKNNKYIIIIEFNNLNKDTNLKDNKDNKKYIGFLIDKEKCYNEFIGIIIELIPNIDITFLN